MNAIGAVLSGMVARKKGHIVNMSSECGRKVYNFILLLYFFLYFCVKVTHNKIGNNFKCTVVIIFTLDV